MVAVTKGRRVQVEYEGKFENGEVFDASAKHGQPLEFVAGEGQVVKGFDSAVIGMKIGDEKEIKILPKDGYGEHNPSAVRSFPRTGFPKDIKAGTTIGIPLPQGGHMPAKISKVTENEVSIDLNHPLAGKTLYFKVKVVKIL